MGQLGFTSSCADPDVWIRLSKRTTGKEYYEYALLYVDDVLVSLRMLKVFYERKSDNTLYYEMSPLDHLPNT